MGNGVQQASEQRALADVSVEKPAHGDCNDHQFYQPTQRERDDKDAM
jgi:hypothetical protein